MNNKESEEKIYKSIKQIMIWNKEIFKKILIASGICIICIVIIPILINSLILKPRLFESVGSGVDWLMFWGGYLGAIISASAAFIILYIQRKDNERQNKENRRVYENNRQLQISILEYQKKSQWLENLKSNCIDYYNAFNQNDIIDLFNLINKNNANSIMEAKQFVNSLIDRHNKVVFALEFLFPQNKDKEEIKLFFKLEEYNHVYQALIKDAQYIIIQLEKDSDTNLLIDGIDEYEKRNVIPQVTNNRIVSILRSKKYISKIGGLTDILKKLLIARQNFSPCLIQRTLSELCYYEEDKINKIIKI